MPIGNLTSQIFANIYLNEFDRFISHVIKPRGYVRYGDDFIIIGEAIGTVHEYKQRGEAYLKEKLGLTVNPANNIIVKAKWGLHFLGMRIYTNGRRLNNRSLRRARIRLNMNNIPSFAGLMWHHAKPKKVKEFQWCVLQKIESELGM